MQFFILGETRARHDDGAEIALGGPARRALLALLLLRPGDVVSADRLADEIAPDTATSASHALQSQVSRLRAVLGPATIERAGTGYRVVVDPEDVDACRFERLAQEGRSALADGDVERSVALLREALALWRGLAAGRSRGQPDGSGCRRPAGGVLTGALEDRIEGELRLRRHRAAVPELRELVDSHPLRER